MRDISNPVGRAQIRRGTLKPEVPEEPDEDAQNADVERLLIDFLNADLDLSFTWLRTADIDARADDLPGCMLALSKARRALDTIRRLEGRIRSSQARMKIDARADTLETALGKFQT